MGNSIVSTHRFQVEELHRLAIAVTMAASILLEFVKHFFNLLRVVLVLEQLLQSTALKKFVVCGVVE